MKSIKRFVRVFVPLIFALVSCNNSGQQKAIDQQKSAMKVLKENTPDEKLTSPNGNYMTAVIDGKQWTAESYFPEYDAGSNYKHVNFSTGADYISFTLSKQGVDVGKHIKFSESKAGDMNWAAAGGLMGIYEGEVVITAADGQWTEGTFSFIASSAGDATKRVTVTDGKFRLAMVPDAK